MWEAGADVRVKVKKFFGWESAKVCPGFRSVMKVYVDAEDAGEWQATPSHSVGLFLHVDGTLKVEGVGEAGVVAGRRFFDVSAEGAPIVRVTIAGIDGNVSIEEVLLGNKRVYEGVGFRQVHA
jgi:hypothetical protein